MGCIPSASKCVWHASSEMQTHKSVCWILAFSNVFGFSLETWKSEDSSSFITLPVDCNLSVLKGFTLQDSKCSMSHPHCFYLFLLPYCFYLFFDDIMVRRVQFTGSLKIVLIFSQGKILLLVLVFLNVVVESQVIIGVS